MTIKELMNELATFPDLNIEVMIEVRGVEAIARGVDYESGGASAWVKIHDYTPKPQGLPA